MRNKDYSSNSDIEKIVKLLIDEVAISYSLYKREMGLLKKD